MMPLLDFFEIGTFPILGDKLLPRLLDLEKFLVLVFESDTDLSLANSFDPLESFPDLPFSFIKVSCSATRFLNSSNYCFNSLYSEAWLSNAELLSL
jgi:hypothetical protein